jgi:hypothetical protein
VSTPRTELGLAVAKAIQAKGAHVVSVIPPRPGEAIRYECRTDVLADEIGVWLRERGFAVNSLGTTQRLDPHAVREEVHYRLETGEDAVRVVSNPGFATVSQFEVLIPSDQELGQRLIPQGPPVPRKHRQDQRPVERAKGRRGT